MGPSAKSGIRHKVSKKKREQETEETEELNTIEVSALRQRKPKKAKLIHKRRLGLLTVANMRMRMDLLLGDIRMMMVDIRLRL